MARRRKLTAIRPLSEMNLTSFMDLSFLLLVTFIITYPLMEQGIPVSLPKGTAQELPKQSLVSVTVDREGRVYLKELPVSLSDLPVRVRELKARDPKLTVTIRADERASYGQLVKVLKVFHDEKVSRLALVTQADR
jgi:biopolymer transport protein ExbD